MKRQNTIKNTERKIAQKDKAYHLKFPWKQVLHSIKQRCENPNNKDYKNYGDCGIENYLTEADCEFLYKRDKAHLMKQPSIDRKENDKNYTMENCRFIEFVENCVKDKRKPILQFDLDGNFVKEFKSQAEAAGVLNIFQSNISNCCLGKRSHVGGFIWRIK